MTRRSSLLCPVSCSYCLRSLDTAQACQGWYGLVAAVGVEVEHAGGQDEAVDGEGEESGGDAGLAVGADQLVGVVVGDDGRNRGDGSHGECGGDPDEQVHRDSSWSATICGPSLLC
jgi:hypothetical protein